MHRCLQVPDLALKIVEECMPDYRERCFANTSRPGKGTHAEAWAARRTLAALARTCRVLQGPALDVLWYYQFGLRHLIECLPEDLRKGRRCTIPGRRGYYSGVYRIRQLVRLVGLTQFPAILTWSRTDSICCVTGILCLVIGRASTSTQDACASSSS